MTGEREDTDVGFPGPEHHIAERSWPMKVAMGTLALLAVVGRRGRRPGRDRHARALPRADLRGLALRRGAPERGRRVRRARGRRRCSASSASRLAYVFYLRRRPLRLRLRERFDSLHTFLVNKWYFDELFDYLFVRPVAAFGRFGRRVVETEFVQGVIVGGATGAVRAGTSFARSLQAGYLRAYAAVLLMGVSALALYFLIAST